MNLHEDPIDNLLAEARTFSDKTLAAKIEFIQSIIHDAKGWATLNGGNPTRNNIELVRNLSRADWFLEIMIPSNIQEQQCCCQEPNSPDSLDSGKTSLSAETNPKLAGEKRSRQRFEGISSHENTAGCQIHTPAPRDSERISRSTTNVDPPPAPVPAQLPAVHPMHDRSSRSTINVDPPPAPASAPVPAPVTAQLPVVHPMHDRSSRSTPYINPPRAPSPLPAVHPVDVPLTTGLIKCDADKNEPCQFPESPQSLISVLNRTGVFYKPGCVHCPYFVEYCAHKIHDIDNKYYVDAINALKLVMEKFKEPQYKKGWKIDGERIMEALLKCLIEASQASDVDYLDPPGWRDWDTKVKKKFNQLCIIRREAFNSAKDAGFTLEWAWQENPLNNGKEELFADNEDIPTSVSFLCRVTDLYHMIPFDAKKLPSVIVRGKDGKDKPAYRTKSELVAFGFYWKLKKNKDLNESCSSVAPVAVTLGGCIHPSATNHCSSLNFNQSTSCHSNSNSNSNSTSNSQSSFSSMRQSFQSNQTCIDGAPKFRESVMKLAEDHLTGLEFASWLSLYLDGCIEAHLPEEWIHNSYVMHSVVIPSMRRCIEKVKENFPTAHPTVPRDEFLQRAAELEAAIEEVDQKWDILFIGKNLSAQEMYHRDTMKDKMDMDMDIDVPPSIDVDQDKLPSDIGLHISEDLESSGKITTTTEAAICTGEACLQIKTLFKETTTLCEQTKWSSDIEADESEFLDVLSKVYPFEYSVLDEVDTAAKPASPTARDSISSPLIHDAKQLLMCKTRPHEPCGFPTDLSSALSKVPKMSWRPGCAHRPYLVEHHADRIDYIDGVWYVDAIDALNRVIHVFGQPEYAPGWYGDGLLSIRTLRNSLVAAAQAEYVEGSITYPPGWERWDHSLRCKFNHIRVIRREAFIAAKNAGFDLEWARQDRPLASMKKLHPFRNNIDVPQSTVFLCSSPHLFQMIPWRLHPLRCTTRRDDQRFRRLSDTVAFGNYWKLRKSDNVPETIQYHRYDGGGDCGYSDRTKREGLSASNSCGGGSGGVSKRLSGSIRGGGSHFFVEELTRSHID